MRRILVRAPTCSADIVTFLKHTLQVHAEELQSGERVEFAFDAERFSFSAAIFESLLSSVGVKICATHEEAGNRMFEVEKL